MKRSVNILGGLALLAGTLCMSACDEAEEYDAIVDLAGIEDPSELPEDLDNPRLYVNSNYLWDDQVINVCWETSGYSTEKAWVRDEIENTWEKMLSIRFGGWSNCTSSGQAGIHITLDNSMVVTGGLGERSGKSTMELDVRPNLHNVWSRCTANSLNREQCLRAVSIHEFGHSLSFAHEHNRPDSSCSSSPAGSLGNTYAGTPYDPKSIMNYCGGATTPSLIDYQGAVQMYGLSSRLIAVVAN